MGAVVSPVLRGRATPLPQSWSHPGPFMHLVISVRRGSLNDSAKHYLRVYASSPFELFEELEDLQEDLQARHGDGPFSPATVPDTVPGFTILRNWHVLPIMGEP
jgi:hypothetical protein